MMEACFVIETDDEHVAFCFDDAPANARLISTAPDLLAACQQLVAYGQEACKHVSCRPSDEQLDAMLADAILNATAAVAKAEGQS